MTSDTAKLKFLDSISLIALFASGFVLCRRSQRIFNGRHFLLCTVSRSRAFASVFGRLTCNGSAIFGRILRTQVFVLGLNSLGTYSSVPFHFEHCPDDILGQLQRRDLRGSERKGATMNLGRRCSKLLRVAQRQRRCCGRAGRSRSFWPQPRRRRRSSSDVKIRQKYVKNTVTLARNSA